MKSRKMKSRKTRKRNRKNNKTRGGAYYNSQWANQENFNSQNGTPNDSPNGINQGYPNRGNWNGNHRYDHRNAHRNDNRNDNRNQRFGNGNNYSYDGDEDTDGEEDIDHDDEEYQTYIERLTQGVRHGCTTTTLAEKLELVETEIEHVVESYDTLVQGIANQTLGDFIESGSLESSYSAELSEWHQNISRRAHEFQRISVQDLNRAFLYLLPNFDARLKFSVLGENDDDSPMHVIIKKYAYKMITSLFTRSNITYAVLNYDETDSRHQFLENLLGVMRSASRITNQYLREDWDEFVEQPMDRVMYVHSGGNMTVMIAGMLCYLYEVVASGHYNPAIYRTDPYLYRNTLLEEIRQEFDTELVRAYGSVQGFYQWLIGEMANPNFQTSIRINTENISDIDLLFMGPEYFVNNINNECLSQINELTAYVLRRIMTKAHHNDGSYESITAHNVMPFAGVLDQNWTRFKFSNMSGISEETIQMMKNLHEQDYWGYRQTSNYIEQVPMYLNRIKQGYQPFFNLDLTNIPDDLQVEYSKKYGECIDCSIGSTTNVLYSHKQYNYMEGNYYTLDTLIYEFNHILVGPRDDKYQKRLDRRDFLVYLNDSNFAPMNTLFQIMGRHIS